MEECTVILAQVTFYFRLVTLSYLVQAVLLCSLKRQDRKTGEGLLHVQLLTTSIVQWPNLG